MDYTESHFLKLQDYIAEGSKGELTAEERAYEELLFVVAGIMRKEGRRAATDWLMNDRNCSRHVANRITGEAANLFWQHDDIKQEAWRNLLFQKLMDAILMWEHTFIGHDEETGEVVCRARAKDFEAYTKIIKQAAAIKRLTEDSGDNPVNNNMQMINIFGSNAQDIGLPQTNRQQILQNPYFQQLRKKDQQRLAMEIGALPLDVDQMLDSSLDLAHEVTGEQ